jgi:hypothetical protein
VIRGPYVFSDKELVDMVIGAKLQVLLTERDLIDRAIYVISMLQRLSQLNGPSGIETSLTHRQEPSGASARIDEAAAPFSLGSHPSAAAHPQQEKP